MFAMFKIIPYFVEDNHPFIAAVDSHHPSTFVTAMCRNCFITQAFPCCTTATTFAVTTFTVTTSITITIFVITVTNHFKGYS